VAQQLRHGLPFSPARGFLIFDLPCPRLRVRRLARGHRTCLEALPDVSPPGDRGHPSRLFHQPVVQSPRVAVKAVDGLVGGLESVR
jgi:hypothetical protein